MIVFFRFIGDTHMTTKNLMPYHPAFLLFLLLAASLTAPFAHADGLPLVEMSPGSGWDAVQAAAAAEAVSPNPNANPPINGGYPTYRSTQLESKVFEGDFTPNINQTKLAIHSDDGADVYIDGNMVLSGKGHGQALERLDQSLYQLPNLNAGQTYHIKIDYQNSWYLGDGDIDGVTLFAYTDVPVVTLDLGGVSGGLTTDVENSGPILASVTNAPQSTATCQVTGEDWEWNFSDVEYSSDGGKTWDASPASSDYYMEIENGYVPSTNFNMTVYQDGDWATSLTATVTYHTTCGDISAAATDWVGTPYSALALPGANTLRHQHQDSFCPHVGTMTAARYYPNVKPPKRRATAGTYSYGVAITCSLGKTWQKNSSGVKVQNGSNRGDTIGWSDNVTYVAGNISFTGLPSGPWPANSYYNWGNDIELIYNSQTGMIDSTAPDSFTTGDTMLGVGSIPTISGFNHGKMGQGLTDQIRLSMKLPGATASTATSHYDIHFHAVNENWQTTVNTIKLSSQKIVIVGPFYAQSGDTADRQLSGTAKFTSVLTAGEGLTIDEVSANFNIQHGREYSVTATGTAHYAWVAHKWNWISRQVRYRYCAGTCDVYGLPGYIGSGPWSTSDALHDPLSETDCADAHQVADAPPSYE